MLYYIYIIYIYIILYIIYNYIYIIHYLLILYIIYIIYIYSFQIHFPYRLLQNTEYISLCYMVGPCCLSILYIAVCICYFQIPKWWGQNSDLRFFIPDPTFSFEVLKPQQGQLKLCSVVRGKIKKYVWNLRMHIS